jgi:hypothetical protein
MAYTFSIANTPASGAVAMYLIKTTLVTAGWAVVADSDGSTYNATGGQVTTGAAGAGGLGNANAWIRLQAPTVGSNTREITIQRANSGVVATDDRAWRIKYSANAHFTGGSPGVSQTGSATDEVFILGGGTDASPTFTASWFAANGGYRWHIAAGGATELYSFYAIALTSATTTQQNAMFLDVMAAGSYSSSDVDPAVMYCSSAAASAIGISEVISSAFPISANVTNPALARAWLGATSAAGASITSNSVNVNMVTYGSNFGNATSLAVNPFSTKDTLVFTLWGRKWGSNPYPPAGIKGISTLFLTGSMSRTNLDTNLSLTKIWYGKLWLPWDGVTTPSA